MSSRARLCILMGQLLAATAAAEPQALVAVPEGDAAQAQARAQQGDRQGAIDLYERAYATSREPEHLLAIARLYEALADQGDSRSARLAITYYQQYLQEKAPADRQEIESHVDRLFRGLQVAPAPGPAPAPPLRPTGATGGPVLAGDPSAPGRTVPIHFTARHPREDYWVVAGGQKCHTPCTLQLVPGAELISAVGSAQIISPLLIPPQPGIVRLHHHKTRLTTGAVLIGLGAAIGASLWAAGFGCYGTGPYGYSNESCLVTNLTLWPIVGGSMFITGIGLVASARTNQNQRVELRALGQTHRPRLSSLALAPIRSGAVAGVGWTF